MTLARARFTQGSVAGHLIETASTSAVSLLAVFLVDIFTLIYVSRLDDQVALAAVGLAKMLMFINSAFASGVVTAAGAVLSARIGKHASRALAQWVTHLLLMVLGVAAGVAVIEWLAVAHLGQWLGADADTYQRARHFIAIVLPCSVLAAAMQLCAQMLRAQGHVRAALLVPLAGAITLALADPLFIFAFGFGLEGAAISYGVSTVVALALGLALVRRHIGVSPAVRFKHLKLHVGLTWPIALPAMLANLAMPVGITYLMLVLTGLGASALAGMAVIDRILQFGYCAFFALPSALVPVLAQNLGAGLDGRVRTAIRVIRRLVVGYGLSIWLLLIVFGPWIADYFHLVDDGRAMFLAFTRFGAGLWILYGLDFVAQSMFLTLSRAWWVPAFGWLRGTLGTVPFVYAGSQWYGASGALVAMWCGNALVALLAILTAAVQARRFFQAREPVLGGP
ncbi:MATE family efflux transporter [Pseudomonas sp. MWU16-30317]|uniref:MATE family efflux transporter n=1 Tax=Pseudomonas sp. MWU16-30317 TaxID=2878095 RepID=UPI001CFC3F58|nr:MATE family efflux transporter [Pseudomonas sp. MWU16-30317]